MTYPSSYPSQPGRHHESDSGFWQTREAQSTAPPRSYDVGVPTAVSGGDGWSFPSGREPAAPPPPRYPDAGSSWDGHTWPPPQQRRPDPHAYPDPEPEPEPEPLPVWQQPEQVWPPVQATPAEVAWAGLRRQVLDRLLLMNGNHAIEAHNRLHTKGALAPHGIALFYADDTAGQYTLRTVTRLFFAGKEADDLPVLLAELTGVAAANVRAAAASGQRWDPRGPDRSMVNGGDMDMDRRAAYIGVGVSTLNTPGRDWYRFAATTDTGYDIPGRGIALLADGTALRRERRRTGTATTDIDTFTNKTLDPQQRGTRYWNGMPYQELDESLRETWHRLHALHEVLRDYLRETPAS